jgi:hypothetical protein
MTGLQPRPAAAQPDQSLPIGLPRYPTPAGSGSSIAWPVPEPGPVSRRRLISRWLDSQAALPLAKVVAVGSAAGWVAAAVVFAWSTASGHALPAGRGAALAAGIALPVIDIGSALLRLSRGSLPSDTPSRATRRQVRRAQMAAGRTPGARASRWRPLQFFLVPSLTASLSRPVRGLLVAGFWTTVLAWTWQTVGAFGAGEAGVQGQRLAAAVWMMHLIVWCSLACRRLGRGRADANGWL